MPPSSLSGGEQRSPPPCPGSQTAPIKIALQARCSPAWKTRSAKQCQSCMQAALSFPVPLSLPRSIGFPDQRKRVKRGAAAGFPNRSRRPFWCSRCPHRSIRCAAFRRSDRRQTQ